MWIFLLLTPHIVERACGLCICTNISCKRSSDRNFRTEKKKMTHMTLPTPSAAVGGLCFKRVPYLKIPSHSPLLHHRRRNCGCGSASSSSSSSSSVSTTPRGSFHTPSPEDRPGLTHICNTLELCFFEVCLLSCLKILSVLFLVLSLQLFLLFSFRLYFC